MSGEKHSAKVPAKLEKRVDPATAAAVVSATASVVTTGVAVYQAAQSTKPKPPPKDK
jgi:hypothetical protein